MPLVSLTLKPDYRLVDAHGNPADNTRLIVKRNFAGDIPQLLVDHRNELGLDPQTPPEGVQVTNHDYSEDDVNVANLWLKVELSEARPPTNECQRISSLLYRLAIDWFTQRHYIPQNVVLDLSWGPTHGEGEVDGHHIKW